MIGKGEAQLYRYTEAESVKPVEERGGGQQMAVEPHAYLPV